MSCDHRVISQLASIRLSVTFLQSQQRKNWAGFSTRLKNFVPVCCSKMLEQVISSCIRILCSQLLSGFNFRSRQAYIHTHSGLTCTLLSNCHRETASHHPPNQILHRDISHNTPKCTLFILFIAVECTLKAFLDQFYPRIISNWAEQHTQLSIKGSRLISRVGKSPSSSYWLFSFRPIGSHVAHAIG